MGHGRSHAAFDCWHRRQRLWRREQHHHHLECDCEQHHHEFGDDLMDHEHCYDRSGVVRQDGEPGIGHYEGHNDVHQPYAKYHWAGGEHAVLLQRAIRGWQRKHGDEQWLLIRHHEYNGQHAADGFHDCTVKRSDGNGQRNGVGERIRQRRGGERAIPARRRESWLGGYGFALQHVVEHFWSEQWHTFAFCDGQRQRGK